MAVTIDELEVQTQPSGGPSNAPTASAGQQPKQDIRAELEKFRERELRLRAD